MSTGPSLSAIAEGSSAIRTKVGAGEPAAVVFHDQAAPSALVSWAWCQLSALDSLLSAMIESCPTDADATDVAAATRVILVPALNALQFSEQRVEELRKASAKD